MKDWRGKERLDRRLKRRQHGEVVNIFFGLDFVYFYDIDGSLARSVILIYVGSQPFVYLANVLSQIGIPLYEKTMLDIYRDLLR